MARSSLTGLRRGRTCPLARWPTPAGEAGRGCKRALLGPFSLTSGRGGRRTMGQAERPPPVRACVGEPGLAHRARRWPAKCCSRNWRPERRPTPYERRCRWRKWRCQPWAATPLSCCGRTGAASGRKTDLDWRSTSSVHREALRAALSTPPGLARDERLVLALSQRGTLLEDEPHADWAVGPREALEVLRQDARLALARDRARGYGRSTHADVVEAWETCFRTDPTSEEAATVLVRAYWASGRHAMATSTYRRCCAALEELGLPVSPAVGEVLETSSPETSPGTSRQRAAPGEERRLVSVLFAQLAGPVSAGEGIDPEEIRELVGGALAAVVTQVEALGGTVSAVFWYWPGGAIWRPRGP